MNVVSKCTSHGQPSQFRMALSAHTSSTSSPVTVVWCVCVSYFSLRNVIELIKGNNNNNIKPINITPEQIFKSLQKDYSIIDGKKGLKIRPMRRFQCSKRVKTCRNDGVRI